MEKHTQSGAEFCRKILHNWIADGTATKVCEPQLSASDFAKVVRKNRLEPLMYVCISEAPETEEWQELLQSFKAAYQYTLLRGLQGLNMGEKICTLLEQAGIRCIPSRGPFFGNTVYEDVGVRYFTDLDLLVPREKRDISRIIMQQNGFQFLNPLMPAWYFRKNHMHWPLRHSASGMICDLHWAVDHPYKLMRMNYDKIFASSAMSGKFRECITEHKLLLMCIHLAKECRKVSQMACIDDISGVAENGMLMHWVDLALFMKKNENIDWKMVINTAREWKVPGLVAESIVGSVKLFAAPVPVQIYTQFTELLTELPAHRRRTRQANTWLLRFANIGHFRVECLEDVYPFVWPPDDYFGESRGLRLHFKHIKHMLYAITSLCSAGVSSFLCVLIVKIRKMYASFTMNTFTSWREA